MRVVDAILVGLGAMGSTYHLAQDDKKVLGLEAFTTAHLKGSSHGASRVIRQTCFESPLSVPLLPTPSHRRLRFAGHGRQVFKRCENDPGRSREREVN
jgi:hypothetical protein